MRLNRGPENGFTLIELLLSIVIIGIITVPLGESIIGVLRNTDATSTRMVLSHDAQISAAYFAQDIAGVGTRDSTLPGLPFKPSIQSSPPSNVPYNSGGTCGTSITPNAVVRFLADDYNTSTSPATQQTDVVAYYVQTVAAERQLHRLKCLGPSSTPVSDLVVAHNLGSADPQVTCKTAGTTVSCTTATLPQQVTMTFTLVKSGQTYPVTLNGQRRQI
jgi:prepilin-type N-terminal cleavage/methylation domain-containing protein